MKYLDIDNIYCGTAEELMKSIKPESVAVVCGRRRTTLEKIMKQIKAMKSGLPCYLKL